MARPHRKLQLPIVSKGFTRREVQKVLKNWYELTSRRPPNGLIGAYSVVTGFYALVNLTPDVSSDTKIGEKIILGRQKLVIGLLKTNPRFVADLLLALLDSEQRLKDLPEDNPERVVEEKFWKIQDIKNHSKLAAALPELTPAKIVQVRNRLSTSKRISNAWAHFVLNELLTRHGMSEHKAYGQLRYLFRAYKKPRVF